MERRTHGKIMEGKIIGEKYDFALHDFAKSCPLMPYV